MRSHLLTSGLLVALISACSSSSMSVPDGNDGGGGSAGAGADSAIPDGAGGKAGMTGGPDGQAGGGGAGVGGGSGGADGSAGAPGDTGSPIDFGEGCNSGWPESGPVVNSMCGADMALMPGTVPDGRYQLTSVSVVGACTPLSQAPRARRAFTVIGNVWTGVDGMPDATGAITGWTHWRALVSRNGTVLSASYQCGTSDLGNSYSLVDDGVVLVSKKAPTIAWAYRFKRM